MFCKECERHGKASVITVGCTNSCTNTLTRHKGTDDHISSVNSIKSAEYMQVALNNVLSKEDETVVKLIDTVVWLAKASLIILYPFRYQD